MCDMIVIEQAELGMIKELMEFRSAVGAKQ